MSGCDSSLQLICHYARLLEAIRVEITRYQQILEDSNNDSVTANIGAELRKDQALWFSGIQLSIVKSEYNWMLKEAVEALNKSLGTKYITPTYEEVNGEINFKLEKNGVIVEEKISNYGEIFSSRRY